MSEKYKITAKPGDRRIEDAKAEQKWIPVTERAIEWFKNCIAVMPESETKEMFRMDISALEKQEVDRWRPCNKKPEYDFQNVLVRWRDKRKGCEKDYYIFEGYVVRGIWCGLFEDVDISDFEPIEWKPLEPCTEEEA